MRDASFAEFAAAEMPRLLRLARTLTGNPHDAADLVQDCLVKVGSRWTSMRADNPSGYAHVVLVRLNIDRTRKIRRRLSLERRAADSEHRAEPSIGVEPWLATAWQQLTAKQRTALALRYFEDLNPDEIAMLMACSPGTVRSHLSRGMATLRSHAHQLTDEGQRR